MTDAPGSVAATPQYRQATDRLGMHLFLATEAMLFGVLLAGTVACRIANLEAAASASLRLNLWLGTANTAILLTSSLCVALAVHWAEAGRRRATGAALAGAACLGLAFMAIKATEY